MVGCVVDGLLSADSFAATRSIPGDTIPFRDPSGDRTEEDPGSGQTTGQIDNRSNHPRTASRRCYLTGFGTRPT